MAADLDELAKRWGWSEACVADVRAWLAGRVDAPTSERLPPTAPMLLSLSLVPATWADSEPPAPLPVSGATPLPARYDDLGTIGSGGMGEVRRVRDRVLDRVLAMKIIRSSLASEALLERFAEEARLTARLQHPGIVPVHDLGRLADGRLYFTMREVRGRTLSDVIGDVHLASPPDRWEAARSGWTFRRLIDAFHVVCEATAYAHSHGVVHRDLKPGNVMVGEFGEVLVLDWGLAKALGSPDPLLPPLAGEASAPRSIATRPGSVVGTPAYMSPEQARGAIHEIDARSDVYLLGGILWEILAGEPPGGAGPTRPVPDDLLAVLDRARAPAPADRYADAGEVAAEVGAWLDGARKRERALAVVAEAERRSAEAVTLRERAEVARAAAAELGAGIPAWAPAERKEPAWREEEAAAELDRAADLAELGADHLLHAALSYVPDLPEAHAALGERHRLRHEVAELDRDRSASAREETLTRMHAEALPAADPTRARLLRWLGGQAALTLAVDHPRATARLYRFVERARRLQLEPAGSPLPLPVTRLGLEHGSWLVTVSAPGRAEVRYPVFLGRGEEWNAGAPVHLPLADALGPDDCYVPAGPFWSGGDPRAPLGLPRRRLWCDGFVMRRFPVTNEEFLLFLNDLVAAGREADAVRWAPRERGTAEGLGALIYGRDAAGRFHLRPDADGDRWGERWPVAMLEWGAAAAYAAWLADRTGGAWRLPGELEWEKAARGADGRAYPWGDGFDPSWACTRDSHLGRPIIVSVDTFPEDVSPYGVRGLAGNVRDWCADVWSDAGPPVTADGRVVPSPADPAAGLFRVRRGGTWSGGPGDARAAFRSRAVHTSRDFQLGFRVVRSV